MLAGLPNSAPVSRVLSDLVEAAPRMAPQLRGPWTERMLCLYGELGGQRRLDPAAAAAQAGLKDFEGSVHDLLLALQTACVLVAQLSATAVLQPSPQGWLQGLARAPDARARLAGISRGEGLAELGVLGAGGAPFGWFADAVDELGGLRGLCLALAERVHAAPEGDPLGELYAALMPRNLRHALGEFYTPPWLAELLLGELDRQPGQSLIDPFCGSGVFLLGALRQRPVGRRLELLPSLRGIDLNPVSCVLARANLVLLLGDELRAASGTTTLPITCADALGHALPDAGSTDGGAQDPDPPIPAADALITNPPWVGWEYLPRAHRAAVEPAWATYGLFTARGREAAFVKEDLSTLALVAAWDRYLKDGGRSVALLRASSMTSTLASRGLRRLSLQPDAEPLELLAVHDFGDLRVFPEAETDAAAWRLRKGQPTRFPVPAQAWTRTKHRYQPTGDASLADVLAHTARAPHHLQPADASDPSGRWMLGDADCLTASRRLRGPCAYTARTGVFTGGANAVYCLAPEEPAGPGLRRYRNVVARAKRPAPEVSAVLEEALVFELVRGRDLRPWQLVGHGHLLCPHTAATKLHAIPPEELAEGSPHALAYLRSMRPVLDARRGFSGWEQAFRERAFYAIQRVGSYSFSPFKVGWRYIASSFTVAVIGPDAQGRPRLANDKVMAVAVGSSAEAHYLCGVLSCAPVRWQVRAQTTGRQISASAIAHVAVPRFEPSSGLHARIAEECAAGHAELRDDPAADVGGRFATVDRLCAELFGLDAGMLRAFQGQVGPPAERGSAASGASSTGGA